METNALQKLMSDIYKEKDDTRGLEKTMLWFISEVGELAELVVKDNVPDKQNKIKSELADCFAWLLSVSNLLELDLEQSLLDKYPYSCSKCLKNPCTC